MKLHTAVNPFLVGLFVCMLSLRSVVAQDTPPSRIGRSPSCIEMTKRLPLTLPHENRGGDSIDQTQMRAELRLDHATTVKRRLLREICWCDTS
jgi:hypothetical protein